MTRNDEPARPGAASRLFGVVMAWTVFTTVFVWLPIVRALARPEGYQWGLFGLRGQGLGGAFWVFPVLAVYAALLFAHAWWARRGALRVMLLLWHFGWAGMLVATAVAFGSSARWQGQGWGFDFPVLPIALVYAAFALLAARWALLDWRTGEPRPRPRWRPANTRRLGVAAALLPVAFLLFRLGSDFNWVTALAIGVTIVQWVTLSEAFEAHSSKGMSTTL